MFLTMREVFAHEFRATRIKWSRHNLSRMLRATGERPERVAEMREILAYLGIDGVFDHGEMWARDGVPCMAVGHPYQVEDDEPALLAELSRFGPLRVRVDDRPSYYRHGTHHVRVELVKARKPYAPFPSTAKTRAANRMARRVLAEEFSEVAS